MYQESYKQLYTSPLRRSEPHCCNVLVRLKPRDKTLIHTVTFRLTHDFLTYTPIVFMIICVQLICGI